MRVDRLISVSGDRSETTAFHPRATIVHGLDAGGGRDLVDRLRRALSGDSDELHVEVHTDGRDLAVFRPSDESHRVIDIGRSVDVTAEFGSADGRVDLLGHLGLSADRAGLAMQLAGSDVEPGHGTAPPPNRTRPLAMAVAVAAIGGGALVAQSAAAIGSCLGIAMLALLVALASGRGGDRGRGNELDDAAIGGNIRAVQDSTGLAEPLPVVITGLFESIPPHHKAAALDAAIRAGVGGQVMIVTEDRDVIDLARFREMAGEVLVVCPVAHDTSPA